MDWSIVFVGPRGAGKTSAVRCMADAADAGARARDALAALGPVPGGAGVPVAAGILDLGFDDRLLMYVAPDGDAAQPVRDHLLEQGRGIVLLVDQRRPDPIDDLDRHLGAIERCLPNRRVPLVIGVTHAGPAPGQALRLAESHLRHRGVACSSVLPPLFALDTDDPTHLRAVLMAFAALIEMAERFPDSGP